MVGKLVTKLPDHSLERKLAIMDSVLASHMGEVRAWGGYWEPT